MKMKEINSYFFFVLVCEPNEHFAYGVLYMQPSCSEPDSFMVEGEDGINDYEFGCICNEGFMLSGSECVRPEGCGCVLEDGIYFKVCFYLYLSQIKTSSSHKHNDELQWKLPTSNQSTFSIFTV